MRSVAQEDSWVLAAWLLRKRQESNPPDAVTRLDGFEGRAPRRGRCSSAANIYHARPTRRRIAVDAAQVVAVCEANDLMRRANEEMEPAAANNRLKKHSVAIVRVD